MSENSAVLLDEKLLHATVKLNTLLCAGINGLVVAVLLLCVTYFSLSRGTPSPDHILNLLGIFLPGYSLSARGAWIGFLWGALLGALSGAIIYRLYARSIRRQVADYFAGNHSLQSLERAVLKVDGHTLGFGIGAINALGVLITTNWLAIRGMDDASVRAGLLAHYLPGYSVSLPGSLFGAVGIFVITYICCVLLGMIYNRVAAMRRKPAAP